MKKGLLTGLLLLGLMVAPAFAENQCINDIAQHHEGTRLTLNKCSLTMWDMPGVMAYIEKHPEIVRLYLSENSLDEIALTILSTNSSLNMIDLSNNKMPLTVTGATSLASNDHLHALILYNDPLSGDVATAFAKSRSLKTLLIGPFKNNDVDAVAAALATSDTLSFLQILKGATDKAAIALAGSKSLRTVELSWGSITDIGANALAQSTLRRLELFDNPICDAGVKALAHSQSLEWLDMSDMKSCIHDASVSEFAQSSTLWHLQIAGSNITDAGAVMLARAPSLKYVYLGGNYISDVGAAAFAKNSSITDLDLICNDVGDAGAVALADNTTLKWLDVGYNNIGRRGITALQNNTTLEYLYIDGNPGSQASLSKKDCVALRHQPKQVGDVEKARMILDSAS